MELLLTYRRTHRLSMRIAKNGDVHVSAPIGMPKRDVETFIHQHQEWIVKARQKTLERQKQRAVFYSQLPLGTRAQKDEATEKVSALVGLMIAHHAGRMGVSPSAISYKPMISRWGICNVKSHSICFSTYLLLLPDWCVEHVVVHELCHLLEPSHNVRFYALMDKYFPLWKKARQETRRIAKGE